MKADPTFWLLARASGLTAYALLTASVLAGLVLKSRPFRSLRSRRRSPIRTASWPCSGSARSPSARRHPAARHERSTSHRLALLVPGASPYRPLAVGIGVLAAELMVVVYASFSLRKRSGPRNWRRLHWATYAIFAAATVHGLAAGTDTAQPWASPCISAPSARSPPRRHGGRSLPIHDTRRTLA